MSWMRTDRWRARTILPPPVWVGDGGRGSCQGRTAASRRETPPPSPHPQGEGEKVAGPAP
jgi:hypothetical protein